MILKSNFIRIKSNKVEYLSIQLVDQKLTVGGDKWVDESKT